MCPTSKEEFTAANFATRVIKKLSHLSKETATFTVDNVSALPASARSLFLTLHVLFPHYLLDALDLIERGLVRKAVLEHTPTEPSDSDASVHSNIYYVHSVRSIIAPERKHDLKTDARSSGSTSLSNSRTCQVHLRAWNCSCPAFAFAAFSKTSSKSVSVTRKITSSLKGLNFGGATFSHDSQALPPICKHLLACVLFEHCGEFFVQLDAPKTGHNIGTTNVSNQSRIVSIQTAAGWAAGADID